MIMRKVLLHVLLAGIAISGVKAQGYVDQEKIRTIQDAQVGSIDAVPKVNWIVYPYQDYIKNNNKGAWTELKDYMDSLPGDQYGGRLEIAELANRVTSDKLKQGRVLMIPTTFPNDFRAYSPYPFHYSESGSIPKLFIIDKFTQTFGAYEYGNLVRWGLVSTGSEDWKTPNGKFNFTWKAEYRLSTAAPPGETWELKWMFNFEPKDGIHVHQYSLPIAYAASHGCVRVSDADAQWNYNWAEGSGDGKKGTAVWVINHNPDGMAAHWGVNSAGEVESLVKLPGEGGKGQWISSSK
jgi:hypothetical protein